MDFDVDAWRSELQAHRERKDEKFGVPHSSPLGPEGRREFDGLDYFDPAPEYRVEATVELDESRETVTMETTADGEELYERTALLHFEAPDQRGDTGEHTLVGYQRVDRSDSLFVPFRDKTTGQQTYPGGRYMELHYDGSLEDGVTFTLDFNLAYNPFCAYSATYECPLPPEENWLDIAIPAGERYEAEQ